MSGATAAERAGRAGSEGLLWILGAGRLIGAAGAFVALSFFTIYLRTDLGLGLETVGAIAALISVGALAGSFLAGYAADRFGRRPALLMNLAVETLSLAALAAFHAPLPVAAIGLVLGLADGGLWPTFGAAVADILPPARRQGGFALMGASVNAGAAIGPAVGGLLLPLGFGHLFGVAAVGVCLALLALALRLPETRPTGAAPGAGAADDAGGGYGVVLRDGPVLVLLALLLLPLTCMGLLITFFPLAADATPGVGPERFGLLFALWGVFIAVFQIPVTRLVGRVRPVSAMAWGFALMAAGFVPIALLPGVWGYLAGIVALAFGEMLNSPPIGALVANLAPLGARARYQSLLALVWSFGGVIAPLAAGMVYGRMSHAAFWLAAGVLALAPAPLLPLWRLRHARVRLAEEAARAV